MGRIIDARDRLGKRREERQAAREVRALLEAWERGEQLPDVPERLVLAFMKLITSLR